MTSGKKYFEADDDLGLSAEILGFAREYQSIDFPNPNRKGCLPNNELVRIVHSGQLAKKGLRGHLLSCSPCFLEFQAARKQIEKDIVKSLGPKTTAKKNPGFIFFRHPLPAMILFLSVCCVSGMIIYGLLVPKNVEIAETKNINLLYNEQSSDIQKTLPGIPAVENIYKAPLVNQSRSKQNIQALQKNNRRSKAVFENEQTARSAIKLDLARTSVLRNENSSETIFSLPARSINLKVKLIPESPKGIYEISLLDEFGKPLINGQLKKSNGKNLTINFDTRDKSGRARLCIAPQGEIPDCFAVKIGKDE